MREILGELQRWYGDDGIGLATVVGVSQSAPRQPGAVMAVSAEGQVAGSVSGGCVEGAVFELSQQVMADGTPRLAHFGFSDADAFAVGLTCGGEIDVFVERLDRRSLPAFEQLSQTIDSDGPVAVATVLAGTDPIGVGAKLVVWPDRVDGSLGPKGLDLAVTDDARGLLELGQTAQRHYGVHGERRVDDVTVFVQSFAPKPRMIVFGAIDYAAAVARMGAFLGYRVTVCDARRVFATPQRFPQADEVVVEWPHRYLGATAVDQRTVICVLTHDPKFDVPVLEIALRSEAGYIGAMGNRRTHNERLERLRKRGLTAEELGRLRSPIGLDLGARTPEETAVSVAAEIIQRHWSGSGKPLSDTTGTIHGTRPTGGEAATAADELISS